MQCIRPFNDQLPRKVNSNSTEYKSCLQTIKPTLFYTFSLSIDDVVTFSIGPEQLGNGGFWGFANLTEKLPGVENPWAGGSDMAPFDREVNIL